MLALDTLNWGAEVVQSAQICAPYAAGHFGSIEINYIIDYLLVYLNPFSSNESLQADPTLRLLCNKTKAIAWWVIAIPWEKNITEILVEISKLLMGA